MSTFFHSQYYAYELTKQNSSYSIGRLNQSLINATVDLNPHQVEAVFEEIEVKLQQKVTNKHLFALKWRII